MKNYVEDIQLVGCLIKTTESEWKHLFPPSFPVPSDSGDHPDLRRSVRPGPEAGQLLHRGLQRWRGS